MDIKTLNKKFNFWLQVRWTVLKKIHLIQWITLISALGTVAAAFGTFLTIHYINKQNQLSFKPEIIVNDENMLLLIEKYKNNYVNFYSSNGDLDTTCFFYYKGGNVFLIHPEIRTNSFNFKLVNIGLGVAKNISITWSFDTLVFVKIVNNNKPPFLQSIALNDKRIIVYCKPDTNYYWDVPIDNKFGFLLPYASSKDMQSCHLPRLYFLAYTLYQTASGYFDTTGYKKFLEDFPALKMTINYTDIVDRHFTRSYKINFSDGPSMYTWEEGGNFKGVLRREVKFRLEKFAQENNY